MADMINFTLPKIDEGSDKQTLKQIKNYLFQLTEQMRYYLNNIDSDNFTEEYYEKMSHMVDAGTSNSKQMNEIQQREHRIVNDINIAKEQIARTIANNKGGYIIFNDTDGDELPDELIICDRPNLEDADKMWRWNLGGLMYNDGGYLPADDMVEINGVWYERDPDDPDHWIESSRKMVVGVDMNGNINASAITTGTLTAIEIKGLYGEIGGWDILPTRLEADNVVYTSGQYVSGYRSGMQALLTDSSIAFYAGCTTPAGGDIVSNSSFYVTQGGYVFAKSGKIGGWNVSNNEFYISTVESSKEIRAGFCSSYVMPTDSMLFVREITQSSTDNVFSVDFWGDLRCQNCDVLLDINVAGTLYAARYNTEGKVGTKIDSYSTRAGLPITAYDRAVIVSDGGLVVSANKGDNGLILRCSDLFISAKKMSLPSTGTRPLGINTNGQVVIL